MTFATYVARRCPNREPLARDVRAVLECKWQPVVPRSIRPAVGIIHGNASLRCFSGCRRHSTTFISHPLFLRSVVVGGRKFYLRERERSERARRAEEDQGWTADRRELFKLGRRMTDRRARRREAGAGSRGVGGEETGNLLIPLSSPELNYTPPRLRSGYFVSIPRYIPRYFLV